MAITLWMDKILSDKSDGWFHDEQSIGGIYGWGKSLNGEKLYRFESFYCCTGCGRHNPHGAWNEEMTYDKILNLDHIHEELKAKFISLVEKKT